MNVDDVLSNIAEMVIEAFEDRANSELFNDGKLSVETARRLSIIDKFLDFIHGGKKDKAIMNGISSPDSKYSDWQLY
jgi:hypothetical protein